MILVWFSLINAIYGSSQETNFSSCGGYFTDETGTIQTPNFPESYPPNQECVWIIEAQMDYNVLVVFHTFQIVLDRTCSTDVVMFLDGDDDTSPVIAGYCGHILPPNLTTTGRYLYINFISDSNTQLQGMNISYSQVPACKFIIDDIDGEITSPNYPALYPPSTNCVWIINSTSNSIIQLNFQQVDIEPSSNCVYDFLNVYDGYDEHSPLVGTFCGTYSNVSLTSSGDDLFIRFRSDASDQYTGFRVTFTTHSEATNITSASILPSVQITTTYLVLPSATTFGNTGLTSCSTENVTVNLVDTTPSTVLPDSSIVYSSTLSETFQTTDLLTDTPISSISNGNTRLTLSFTDTFTINLSEKTPTDLLPSTTLTTLYISSSETFQTTQELFSPQSASVASTASSYDDISVQSSDTSSTYGNSKLSADLFLISSTDFVSENTEWAAPPSSIAATRVHFQSSVTSLHTPKPQSSFIEEKHTSSEQFTHTSSPLGNTESHESAKLSTEELTNAGPESSLGTTGSADSKHISSEQLANTDPESSLGIIVSLQPAPQGTPKLEDSYTTLLGPNSERSFAHQSTDNVTKILSTPALDAKTETGEFIINTTPTTESTMGNTSVGFVTSPITELQTPQSYVESVSSTNYQYILFVIVSLVIFVATVSVVICIVKKYLKTRVSPPHVDTTTSPASTCTDA